MGQGSGEVGGSGVEKAVGVGELPLGHQQWCCPPSKVHNPQVGSRQMLSAV